MIPDDRPSDEDAANQTAIERFRTSMNVTYEMWHGGIGYDLDALESATVDERAGIEAQLVGRGITDWRDVEALVAIGTDRSLDVVRSAGISGSTAVRLAVARIAPELVSHKERAETLVHAIETATLMDGLSGAIDQAAEFHPPAVVDALLRGPALAKAKRQCTSLHCSCSSTGSPMSRSPGRSAPSSFAFTAPASNDGSSSRSCVRSSESTQHRSS